MKKKKQSTAFDLNAQYAAAASASDAQVADPNATADQQAVQPINVPASAYQALQQYAAAGDYENLGRAVAEYLT